jgi:hypothetical protein
MAPHLPTARLCASASPRQSGSRFAPSGAPEGFERHGLNAKHAEALEERNSQLLNRRGAGGAEARVDRSLLFPKERILGNGSAPADSTPLRLCASAPLRQSSSRFAVREHPRGASYTSNAKLAEALEERQQQPQQGNRGDAGGAEARVETGRCGSPKKGFGEWLRTGRQHASAPPAPLRPLASASLPE